MNIKQLNHDHAIDDGDNKLFFEKQNGGFPNLVIRTHLAEAVVSLYGGQILSYKSNKNAQDLLFLSPDAFYQKGKAIRGGIPICAPWFGTDPTQSGRPSHGFARLNDWSVIATSISREGEAQVVLCCASNPESYELWPNTLRWELRITVGKTLRLALTTHNTGARDFTLSQAFHTYFAVGEAAQTYILGFDRLNYFDNAQAGQGALKQQSGTIGIHEEVDRVYTASPPEISLLDAVWKRRIRITASGSNSTVVWNPWETIAANMADLPNQAYRHFVCIEISNAGLDTITLAAGEAHTLAVEYSCETLDI